MENNTAILSIALVVLGYGYFSKLLLPLNISGPMIFTGIGILLSPLGFSITVANFNAELVQIIVEIALIIVLFSYASGLNLEKLKHEWGIPARLLFIGLPIAIAAATVSAGSDRKGLLQSSMSWWLSFRCIPLRAMKPFMP